MTPSHQMSGSATAYSFYLDSWFLALESKKNESTKNSMAKLVA